MASVKNETNSTEVSINDLKSVFHGTKVKMSDKAREIISNLNSVASDITSSQFSVRSFTYAYVAELIDAAHEFAEGGEVTSQLLALFEALKLPAPDMRVAGKHANPFLSLVRAADGEWISGLNGRGVPYTVWKPNRSGEKYAAVCRFAVTNGFTGSDLHALLGGKEDIEITYKGEDHKIKPTLNAIIAFDRLQFPTEERAVLTTDDWRHINRLSALVEIPFTERMAHAFTLSEGALCEGLLMVRDGKLMLLGSSGRIGNVVQRTFKERYTELDRAHAAAMRKPETPAEVPAEVLINE